MINGCWPKSFWFNYLKQDYLVNPYTLSDTDINILPFACLVKFKRVFIDCHQYFNLINMSTCTSTSLNSSASEKRALKLGLKTGLKFKSFPILHFGWKTKKRKTLHNCTVLTIFF